MLTIQSVEIFFKSTCVLFGSLPPYHKATRARSMVPDFVHNIGNHSTYKTLAMMKFIHYNIAFPLSFIVYFSLVVEGERLTKRC